jgi:formyl-CoA transferase
MSLKDALDALDTASVPSGPIYEAADIVPDPHFQERNMLLERTVDIGTDEPQAIPFPGVVPLLANEPGSMRWLGPDLGAHNDEVLAELGYSPSQRQSLRDEGTI